MLIREIGFAELGLTPRGVWNSSGNAACALDEQTEELFRSVWNEIAAVCRPCYGYEIYRNEGVSERTVGLGGVSLKTGPVITPCLKDAEEFALIVATAGAEFEALLRRIKASGDIVREFLADMVGSEIAEAIGTVLSRNLAAEQAERGYAVSNSYSPGYCGWHVREQQILFSLLPKHPCGITLSESCLMTPIKSISGIIAVGPRVIKAPYGCAICGRKDCYKKRI
ncbi:vitamin B12 dependent-methionine synthase activation domain-containing protein [uncultured Alistipes sp.]|uniref:vitamin B12 dependent-methionine synthase activation domain-containing protein n=1 Tax=uncultured Alistipes sp. TaxID=538949 RepID=UPI0025D9F672|nr:vitamin B12 dependent-methionine synthase activation domain-containing protein [uncultured Alistipes sp.]